MNCENTVGSGHGKHVDERASSAERREAGNLTIYRGQMDRRHRLPGEVFGVAIVFRCSDSTVIV